MRKIILFICVVFLFISCSRGFWLTPNVYRPKHPKFSILKQQFAANELVNNSAIYISTKKFVNYDGNVVVGYMGLYSDGRMIIDNTWKDEMLHTLNERNSFKTASSIGYYTTKGNTIKMEYFLPGDGGHYESREGVVKKDTIILSETINLLLKREIRIDTLVLSSYPLL